MNNFSNSNIAELLVKYRDLSSEEAFVFYDKIFNEKDSVLSIPDFLPILFNGFFDDALDLSYMAQLLNIIRDFRLKIENELYIKNIIFEVKKFYPHANYWYSLLLMDIILADNTNKIVENIRLLTPDIKATFIQQLIKIQLDDDWIKDKTLQELIQRILQSIES